MNLFWVKIKNKLEREEWCGEHLPDFRKLTEKVKLCISSYETKPFIVIEIHIFTTITGKKEKPLN